jgi:hypothetical protein
LAVFAAGAALACSWALSDLGVSGILAVAAALTALTAAATAQERKLLRFAAQSVLAGVHLFLLAVLSALASVLAWSVPASIWVLAAATLASWAATRLSSSPPVRVPLVLPIGILIAALAYGWMREDGRIRCDDYLRVRELGLEVVLPSTPELESCAPGDALVVTRYPRFVFEDRSGERLIFSTQRGDHDYSPPLPPGRRVESWLDGAVCEARLRDAGPPRCLGQGKADEIVESTLRDRLYTTAHDAAQTTIYVLPGLGPIRILAEKDLPLRAGILYFDDRSGTIALCEEEAEQLYFFRAADLGDAGSVPVSFNSTYVRYDQALGEGLACGVSTGERFVAAAFRGDPFSFRPLAAASRYPSSWLAGTWGCDWDPAERRAYVAVASFGVLEVIDYDSGLILDWGVAGFGMRAVVFDAQRRLVYMGSFPSGKVIAVDADTLAVAHRWFAGRFLRDLKLTRDRSALLATSTLGVVRIPLPGENE